MAEKTLKKMTNATIIKVKTCIKYYTSMHYTSTKKGIKGCILTIAEKSQNEITNAIIIKVKKMYYYILKCTKPQRKNGLKDCI